MLTEIHLVKDELESVATAIERNALHGGHSSSVEADISDAWKCAKEQEDKVKAWREDMARKTASELDAFIGRLVQLVNVILSAHDTLLNAHENKDWITAASCDGMPLADAGTKVSIDTKACKGLVLEWEEKMKSIESNLKEGKALEWHFALDVVRHDASCRIAFPPAVQQLRASLNSFAEAVEFTRTSVEESRAMLAEVKDVRKLLETHASAAEQNGETYKAFASTMTIKPWKDKIDDQIANLRKRTEALEGELHDFSTTFGDFAARKGDLLKRKKDILKDISARTDRGKLKPETLECRVANHLSALEGLHKQAEAAQERVVSVQNIAQKSRAAFTKLEIEVCGMEEMKDLDVVQSARSEFAKAAARLVYVWMLLLKLALRCSSPTPLFSNLQGWTSIYKSSESSRKTTLRA